LRAYCHGKSAHYGIPRYEPLRMTLIHAALGYELIN
jgi:hypothetical protein